MMHQTEVAEIQREQSQQIHRYQSFDSSLVAVCDKIHMAQDNKATVWIRGWAVSAPRWVRVVCTCDCSNCNHSLCGLLRTRLTVCVCTYLCRRSTCIHECLEMTQALLVQAGEVLSYALIERPASAAWLQTDPGECVTAPSSSLPSFSSSFTHSLLQLTPSNEFRDPCHALCLLQC